jgi:NADPH-dependent 2,4-dienoyl-CoA reductase/sulfur reductase-like enzyme
VSDDGLVIIGGSDAGVMAGLWAKEKDPGLPVTIVVRDTYPNFSICGIPFYLSGETPEWPMLAHRTAADLEALGLRLLLGHEATAIDPAERSVEVVGPGDEIRCSGQRAGRHRRRSPHGDQRRVCVGCGRLRARITSWSTSPSTCH